MFVFLKTTLAAAVCGTFLLASPAARAQTTPSQKLQPDHYYVNGQSSTKEAVKALEKKKAIKSVNVLTGQQAVDYTHDATSQKAALVTTN